ncbi:MAG: MarR family transcriptional regulator [Candidatus Kariarchaeaceae archaeon]|jgi:DNA-binding MarR family transcriptional regulator
MLDMYKLPKLPKSSKRLILALSDHGSLTQKQLIANVNMPAKTVRYALKKLSEQNLIVSQHNLEDMRSMFYNLNPDIDFGIMEQHIEDAKILVEAEVA